LRDHGADRPPGWFGSKKVMRAQNSSTSGQMDGVGKTSSHV
jgi:hypothetical protein